MDIHRFKVALDLIDVKVKIPYDFQAPKMADIRPIENVWDIVKQELDGKEFQNNQELESGQCGAEPL